MIKGRQEIKIMRVQEIPLDRIKRPLPRVNDPNKVQALMESIAAIGQQEPIDVLEVDGEYYGFSGCHRYEACQRLGKETIIARVRKAPRSVLKMHLA
jgi:sulfiredoxin